MASEQPRVVQMERIDCETGEVTVIGERAAPPTWRVERKELPSEIDVTIHDGQGDCVLRATKFDSLLRFLVVSMQDRNQFQQQLEAEIASQKSELASLRQIVADVETCRAVSGYFRDSLEIFADSNCRPLRATVRVNDGKYHYAETWQAALHAAAEWVRAGG